VKKMTMSKKRDRKQSAQASPTLALPSAPSTPQSDKPEGELPEKMTKTDDGLARAQQTFATTDIDLIAVLALQAAASLGDPRSGSMVHKSTRAAVHSLGARDGLEALLAVQMVGVHNLAMKFLANAALEDQTDYGREVSVNRANRLLRTFTVQVEALKKHRSKGEQHFTVEHVHVHSGGQAVVGAVNQGHAGTEAPRSPTGGEERNGKQ
jgi:hypothetical protein